MAMKKAASIRNPLDLPNLQPKYLDQRVGSGKNPDCEHMNRRPISRDSNRDAGCLQVANDRTALSR